LLALKRVFNLILCIDIYNLQLACPTGTGGQPCTFAP